MTAEAIQPHIEPSLTGTAVPLRLGELLVQAGKLSARDLERALLAQPGGETGWALAAVAPSGR